MNMTTFALPSSNTSCLLPPTKLYERRAKYGGINVFIITRRRRWEWRAKYHRTRLMATWVAAATMFLLKYSIYLVTIWFRQHLIRTGRYCFSSSTTTTVHRFQPRFFSTRHPTGSNEVTKARRAWGIFNIYEQSSVTVCDATTMLAITSKQAVLTC